jgi:hypothetical protein
MFFKLFFQHHEMKPAPEDSVIKTDNPESVPPAEMIGENQYRKSPVVKSSVEAGFTEIPFCSPE